MSNTLKSITSNSPGPDGIKGQLLKSARLEIAEIISTLFNQSLYHSFVLKQWKESNITPIPKDATSFRPISQISQLGKAFERGIAKYIISITTQAGIWRTNKQYGFLPSRSTMDAIIQVIENWSHAKDANENTYAIFFDFSKAFDLVDHEILLTKLKSYLPTGSYPG